jgi:hypothetical protein
MIETQRKRRGHNFLPPKSVKVPALYATNVVPAPDKVVAVHYFSAGGDWWLTELSESGSTGRLTGFGYVRLAAYPECAQWGYVDMEELETINAHHGFVIVERDCFWTPVKFRDLKI